MIERLHEHIIDELRTSARTDTVFILTSMLLNFIALGINTSIASESDGISSSTITIFFIFIVLILVVNSVAVIGLLKGKQTRYKLLNGLLKMYKDHNVEGYYDPSILVSYNTRYTLFTITVAFTGFIAIAVPVVIMVMQ